MSIQSEITRISGNVSDALDAIEDKGVTIPTGSNSDDLATLIGQIDAMQYKSGNIATFSTSLVGMPMTSVVADIEPMQTGTGDPTPSNVRTITGRTQVNVTRTGHNICPPAVIGRSFDNNTGADIESATQAATARIRVDFSKHNYHLHNTAPVNSMIFGWDADGNYVARTGGALNTEYTFNHTSFTNSGTGGTGNASSIVWIAVKFYQATGQSINNVTGTELQIEPGNSFTTYTSYQGLTSSVSLGRTVYAGVLNVTTGALTVTHGYIESYAGETLPGKWICDRAVYVAGTTPPTGAQVVYELATVETYQLTRTQVTALLGENNVWVDSGTIEVTIGGGSAVIEELNVSASGTYTAGGGVDGYSPVVVPAGTAGTPTASKGTVSNHAVSVTPSVTNTSGYVTGSTINGTAITVSASELVSGSETKTANGTYDVTNLASLVVNVASSGANFGMVTTTNSSNQNTSISFTLPSGRTPKAFFVRLTSQIARNSNSRYYYVYDMRWDGSSSGGVAGNTFYMYSGTLTNVTAGYSYSQDGTTFTLSSTGTRSTSPGSFYNGTYEMVYVY